MYICKYCNKEMPDSTREEDCFMKDEDSLPASVACYVALYRDSQQITPDDFKAFTRTKKCGPETTLGEIMEWSKGLNVEISGAT